MAAVANMITGGPKPKQDTSAIEAGNAAAQARADAESARVENEAATRRRARMGRNAGRSLLLADTGYTGVPNEMGAVKQNTLGA